MLSTKFEGEVSVEGDMQPLYPFGMKVNKYHKAVDRSHLNHDR